MVSVIILNRNGGDYFQKCVQSVLDSSYQDFEIIVRDNGSTDGSVSWLESLNDKRIKIYQKNNDGNFSTMNNEMVEFSKRPLLLFLNNDCFLDPNTIENMVGLISLDPMIGCVGATLRYPNGKLQHAGIVCGPGGDPINLSDDAINIFGVSRAILSDVWEHKSVTAACLMMRRNDFDQIDGFDPQYHWAYDDVDLCLRVHYHLNKKNVVSPDCTGVHVEGSSKANPKLEENLKKLKNRWGDLFQTDIKESHQRKYHKRTDTPELSFVVCVNDFEQLNKILVKSIYASKSRYYLIPIYNFNGKYSAAQALNLGQNLAETEWVVFTHQDVEYDPNWIDLLFTELQKCQKLGVAGLAGVKIVSKNSKLPIPVKNGKIHINAIGSVKTPEKGKLATYGQFPSGEVDVVDELCIITKKSNKLDFDEKTLTHFHFYAVDLSLQAKNKGLQNYVINAPATHHSNGSSSLSKGREIYWREFQKVFEKWKTVFPTIVTTTGFWNNEGIETFYKEEIEKKETKTINVAATAQTLQLAFDETVELKADQPGEWFVNGVSCRQNSLSLNFKPPFQGLHKISHHAQRISDWWIHTTPSSCAYILGMSQNFHTHQLGEIFGSKEIIQEVICDREGLAKIEIFIGTYRRKNACRLSLHVESENGSTLRSCFLDSTFIRDNDWNEFLFDAIVDSKNQKYRIKVFSPDAEQGNALTVYYVNHVFSFGSLYQNNRKVGGCLSFRLFYKS
jgi:GT2 family glycosyltransferase